MISITSLLQAVVILQMVETSRAFADRDEHPELTLDEDEGYKFCRNALLFLGRNVKIGQSEPDTDVTINQLWMKMRETFSSPAHWNLIDSALRRIMQWDIFLHFMDDKLPDIFLGTGVNENGLLGPTRITESSVVGIVIRTIRALWVAADFDEQARTFDCYVYAISTRLEGEIVQSRAVKPVLTPWEQLEQACLRRDFKAAEAIIHDLYDFSGVNPLTISFQKDRIRLEALAEGLHSTVTAPSALRSNQLAMLTLAVLWYRLGIYEKAKIAVEEALKMAHHGGDHVSVTRCLLLLFQIQDQQAHGPNPPVSMDIHKLLGHPDQVQDPVHLLERCLQRAGALHLHDIVAESALLLATAQLQQAQTIRTTTTSLTYRLPHLAQSDAISSAVGEKVRRVLMLVRHAVHGESQGTVMFAQIGRPLPIDDPLHSMTGPGMGGNAAAAALMAANAGGGNNKWTVAEELTRTGADYANLCLRGAEVTAEAWVSVDEYSLAIEALCRAVYRWWRVAPWSVLLAALGRQLRHQLNLLYTQLNSLSASDRGDALVRLLRGWLHIQQAVSEDQYCKDLVAVSVDLIGVHLALHTRDWSRGKLLAERHLRRLEILPVVAGDISALQRLDKLRAKALVWLTNHAADLLTSSAERKQDLWAEFRTWVEKDDGYGLLHESFVVHWFAV